MWQSPSQRLRMLNRARRAERERSSQKKKNFHLRRVQAEVKIRNTVRSQVGDTSARVILNDITPISMILYSAEPLLPGQDIAITLEEPKQFFVNGHVVWCELFNFNSHIITSNPVNYRSYVEFRFAEDVDRHEVEQYCTELATKYLNMPLRNEPAKKAA